MNTQHGSPVVHVRFRIIPNNRFRFALLFPNHDISEGLPDFLDKVPDHFLDNLPSGFRDSFAVHSISSSDRLIRDSKYFIVIGAQKANIEADC
ncbi:MAG: hypothetical protein QNK37_26270 [Acidobacteriota bacterium]|nr:hypothetical protein [Acidobacteriota bacterium]